MGIIILTIALVIEAAFAAYCIKTKSSQRKIRSIVRIGVFITFVILVLLSVIEWSFRWKLFAAILLTWALLGTWSLIYNRFLKQKNNKEKKCKTASIVFKAIAMLLVVLIAVTPALVFPQYKLPKMTGEYKIATSKYSYTDKKRVETFSNTGENREVNVEFWYPQNVAGKYPLVVFSHGSFGVKTSNTSTYMELASHGYVVCSIDHPYHSMFTVDADGKYTMVNTSFVQEVLDCNNDVYDDKEDLNLTKKWIKLRTEDISFVIDTIIKNAKDNGLGPVYQLIDTDKIGLMGHSLGGAASAQVARERDDIDAVIDIDGEMSGEYIDFIDGKPVLNSKIYPVPILNFYSDDVMNLLKANPDFTYPNKAVSDTAPNAYDVYIKGTNHMSLTDLPLFSPLLTKLICGSVKKINSQTKADKYYAIETMNNIVLKFFDSYLKGKGSFDSAGTY